MCPPHMSAKGVALNRPSVGHEDMFDLTGRTGSYFYMAPEVLNIEAYNEKASCLFYFHSDRLCWAPLRKASAMSILAYLLCRGIHTVYLQLVSLPSACLPQTHGRLHA